MYAGSGRRTYAAKRASHIQGRGIILSDEQNLPKLALSGCTPEPHRVWRRGEGNQLAGRRRVRGTPLPNEVPFDTLSRSQLAAMPMAKPKVKKSGSKSSRATTSSTTSQSRLPSQHRSPTPQSYTSSQFSDSSTLSISYHLQMHWRSRRGGSGLRVGLVGAMWGRVG